MLKKMDVFSSNIYFKIRSFLGNEVSRNFSDWKTYEKGINDISMEDAKKFYTLYHSLELFNIVIDNVKENIKYQEGDFLHGSRRVGGITSNINPHSNNNTCDFGNAFYMGDSIQQVLTFICTSKDAYIYNIGFNNRNNYKRLDLELDIDWVLFVFMNRGYNLKDRLLEYYSKIESEYDLIVGGIADDRLFKSLDAFAENLMTDIELLEILKRTSIGKQYAFKTEAICNELYIKSKYKLSNIEKVIIQAVRKNNIDIANNIRVECSNNYGNLGNRLNKVISIKEKELL